MPNLSFLVISCHLNIFPQVTPLFFFEPGILSSRFVANPAAGIPKASPWKAGRQRDDDMTMICADIFWQSEFGQSDFFPANFESQAKPATHYDIHGNGDKNCLSVYPFARQLRLQAVLEPKSSSCVGRGKPAASLKMLEPFAQPCSTRSLV